MHPKIGTVHVRLRRLKERLIELARLAKQYSTSFVSLLQTAQERKIASRGPLIYIIITP